MLFTSFSIIGQVKCDWAEVRYGVESKRPKGQYSGAIFKETGIVITFKDEDRLYYYDYDDDFNFQKDTSMSLHVDLKEGEFEVYQILEFRHREWQISKIVNKEERRIYFYVQEIDSWNKTLKGSSIELVSFNFLGTKTMEGLEFEENEKGNKILVTHFDANKKRSEISFDAVLFSKDWERLEEVSYKFPRKELRKYHIFYSLYNDKIVSQKSTGHMDRITYEWVSTSIETLGGDDDIEFDEMEEQNVIKSSFQTKERFETIEGNEYVGLYWNANSKRTIGIAYYKEGNYNIGENDVLVNRFPESKYSNTGNYTFKTSKTIKTQSGFFVFAEREYYYEEKTYNGGVAINRGELSESYDSEGWETRYGDLVVAKLDLQGKLVWFKVIPKTSYLLGRYGQNPNLKFGAFRENVYVTYEITKTSISGDRRKAIPNPGIKGEVYLSQINAEGELMTSQLFHSNDKESNKISILEFIPMSSDFLISRKVKGGGFQLGIIEVQ